MPKHTFKIMRKHLLRLLFLSPAFCLQAETLEDAWRVALENNSKINAAEANTEAAEQQLKSVESLRLPTININGGYNGFSQASVQQTNITESTIPTNLGVLQLPSRNVQFNTTQKSAANAQAVISVPVFTSGRISHNIDSASENLEAEKANAHDVEIGLKMQIAEAYISILRAQNEIEVSQIRLDSFSQHFRDINLKYKQGLITGNDLLASQVTENDAKELLTHSENQLKQAKRRYNQLLSRKLDSEVNISAISVDLPTDALENMIETALKQRHELQLLSHKSNALSHQAESIEAEQLPQISLNGGYVYQENRYQLYQDRWMFEMNLNWKIFDNSTKYKSGINHARALNYKAQRDDMMGQIVLEVEDAWQDIQESQQKIKLAELTLKQAEENKRVVDKQNIEGLVSNIDALKARELYIVAKNNLNNAQYDAALAAIRLKKANGMI